MDNSPNPKVHLEPPGATSDPSLEDSLLFSGVFLLTTGPEGPTAVPSLHLAVGKSGIRLEKSGGTQVWEAPWKDIEELSACDRSSLPTGGQGVVLAVTVRAPRHETHRFVVPSRRPDNLELSITSISALYNASGSSAFPIDRSTPPPTPREVLEKGESTEESIPAIVTVAVVLAATVAVTFLLLAAGNIVKL
ncbi:MAG: hypothetical protein M1134_00540 [Actinobacteria bacterium]|jgi:hypothetical protein|nr:hypothetical protein [Actinomycetota bacterium]